MDKRIKILYTIPNFDTAGTGKSIIDLCNHLDRSKFEIHVACQRVGGALFDEVQKLDVQIHITNLYFPLRPYATLFTRVSCFVHFLKQHEIDIVHSWNWSSDWSELLACKRAGVKYVYTKKNMSWNNIHWKIKSFLSDYIITINSEIGNFFKYKKEQKLVPLCVDVDNYSLKRFSDKRRNNGHFKIITIANLVPVKGIELIFEALKILNKENISLQIVGDDSNEYGVYLKQLSSTMGLNSVVKFEGQKLDVRPYIADADLYIIPTLNYGRKEALGVALIEAMSMEVPVIGSDVVGIAFVLENFEDLLFPSGDEAELAKRIEKIFKMSFEERVRLGERLREEVELRFSIPNFIKEHQGIYASIVKS